MIAGVFIAGSLALTSCTKDLKNDINDLKTKTASQHGQIDSLANRLDSVDIILGFNEPIIVTTTFTDNADNTRTIKDTCSFKRNDNGSQYARERADGSYNIYIQRWGGLWSDEEVYVSFRYNPATKTISEKKVLHVWNDADDYYDRADYGNAYSTDPGLTINITVNSFNLTTGQISLNVSASGDADYARLMYYNGDAPNDKPYSTSLSFNGKVKVFAYEQE